MQILVVGMHRSGTSMVTRLLNMAGAYVGIEGDLTDTAVGTENPKGFWERRDVRAANEALLAAAGCDWDAVQRWDPARVPAAALEAFQREARFIALRLDANRPWVVKDPRLCLTLGQWRSVLEVPRVVLCLREPLEVAESLRSRNSFPLEVGLALWEAYVRAAVHGMDGAPAFTVVHSRLVTDPQSTLVALHDALQAAGVRGLAIPGSEEVARFVDPKLHRSRMSEPHGHDTHAALALFRALADEQWSAPIVRAPLSEASSEALCGHERYRAMLLSRLAGQLGPVRTAGASTGPDAGLREALERNRKECNALLGEIQLHAVALGESRAAQVALAERMKGDAVELQRLRAAIVEREEKMAEVKLRAAEQTEHERQALCKESEANLVLRGELAVAVSEGMRDRSLLEQERAATLAAVERSRQIEADLAATEAILTEAARAADACSRAAAAVRASWRWRIGDRAVRCVEAVLRRPRVVLAHEYLQSRLHSLELLLRRRSALRPAPSKLPVSSGAPRAASPPAELPAARAVPLERPARCVVFTAIAGGYDKLMQPEMVSPDCDYVVFSDGEPGSTGAWQHRRMDYINADPTRSARFVKLHPHLYFPGYEYSIWVDANLLLRGDPVALLESVQQSPIAAFIHPHRRCAYDEAEEILKRGSLDAPDVVREHVAMLSGAGYPSGQGLTETNVLVRRHNDPALIAFMSRWWKLLDNGSKRDQLSVDCAAWQADVKISPLAPAGTSVRNHALFERFLHGARSTFVATDLAMPPPPARAVLRPPTPDDATLARISTEVVVCVHNAPDDVDRCLQSVLGSLARSERLVIVDDGSGPETQEVIARHVKRSDRISVIRHEVASGYTKAANAGVRASSADFVVLLNSDTIVPPGWLARLKRAAFSSEHIGIVGPLSNAASWQSVPEILDAEGRLAVNALPPGITVAAADLICQAQAHAEPVLVPLLNGFCFGMKRGVIETVGAFDEKAFPKGYGEENDFCFRATDCGWVLAIATDCYVYHAKSKSYSPEGRDILAAEGSKAFRAKYSARRIANAIESTKYNPLLQGLRRRFGEALAVRIGNDGPASSLRQNILPSTPMPDAPDGPAYYDLSEEQLRANRAICDRPWPFRERPPASMLWFVPDFDHILRGGIRTIFTIADELSRTWGTTHWFAVYGKSATREAIASRIRQAYPALRFDVLAISSDTDPRDLPEADAGVCSLWNSAYHLAKYNRCRAKLYLAQDYEPTFYRAGTTFALIQQTYSLGFNVIANSAGVASRVRELTQRVDHFDPGVDHATFWPLVVPAPSSPRRVVFYGRPRNPRNAFELGIAALRLVKRRLGAAVEIVSVGGEFDASAYGCDGMVENLGVLDSMEKVAELYRSAHAGLVFMYSAHPSYQPLEYMASGCVTVTNENPCNKWLLRDRENCLLAHSLPSEVAARIIEVLEDEALFTRLRATALADVGRLTWDGALSQVRRIIQDPSR